MRVLTLTTPNTENGLGCRVTLWVAGCSHHCPGCHNQHTWDYNQGVELSDNEYHTVYDKLCEELSKPYIKGLTLSGGDPLDQNEDSLWELEVLLFNITEDYPGKDIWIYAGDTFETLIQNPTKKTILEYCDVLVDGKFVKELYDPDIPFRGSKNQRIIDLKRSFEENKVIELEIK